MDDSELTCPKCAREVDDSLTWCPYCGAELASATGPETETSEAPGTEAPETEEAGAEGLSPAGDEAEQPGPAAGSSPRPMTMVVVGVVVLALLGAAIAAFLLLRNRNGGSGDLAVASMEVGQCWNDPADFASGEATEVFDVPEVPCEEPHANEVYALVEHPLGEDGVYPGTGQVELDSFSLCLAEFEDYVAVPFRESPLDIFYIYPTAESWVQGDREIVCSIYMIDETPLVGSEQDSDLRLVFPAVDTSTAGSCEDLADLTIQLAQDSIDFFDSLSPEELDQLADAVPPELMPLLKGESLILGSSVGLGCDIALLNSLVVERAATLTATGEFGSFLAEDIAANGFFAEGP